jgi:hypothetical protein
METPLRVPLADTAPLSLFPERAVPRLRRLPGNGHVERAHKDHVAPKPIFPGRKAKDIAGL